MKDCHHNYDKCHASLILVLWEPQTLPAWCLSLEVVILIFKEQLLILLPFLLDVVPDDAKEDESHGDVNSDHDDFDTDTYVLNSVI